MVFVGCDPKPVQSGRVMASVCVTVAVKGRPLRSSTPAVIVSVTYVSHDVGIVIEVVGGGGGGPEVRDGSTSVGRPSPEPEAVDAGAASQKARKVENLSDRYCRASVGLPFAKIHA